MTARRIARTELAFAAALLCASMLPAQTNGPLRPVAPVIPHPPAAAKPEPPPPIPAEQIIQRFAANEDAMLSAFAGYSFEKTVSVQELGPDNKPAGAAEIVTQQAPGSDGKRYEKIVHRTPSTLRYLEMERGDLSFVDAAPIFPLTTSQLPRYEITYEGVQPLDELSVYVFSVTPRSLDRAHAYFSGAVWVDKDDFVIVKTIGKWVMETGDVTSAALPFTVFETYREQVGAKAWFPTYSRSDGFFDRGTTHVPIRMITRWKYTQGALPAYSDASGSAASDAGASPSGTSTSGTPATDASGDPDLRHEH